MGNVSSFLDKLLAPFTRNNPEENLQTLWRAENTQSKRIIGSGPNGSVIEASNIKTGQSCAIKTIEYEKNNDWNFEYAQKKAKLLIEVSNLKHPNILKTYVCEKIEVENSLDLRNKYAFIMELYDGNLATIISERKKNQEFFDEFYLLKELLQLVGALNEAYKIGFHHYSIKDENIFMNKEDNRLILGDFDTFENAILKPNPKNLAFHPPEIFNSNTNLLNENITDSYDYSKGDIYSLGLIFVKLALLEESLSPENMIDNYLIMLKEKGYPKLYETLKTMLVHDPEARPSLSELFKSIQEQICEMKGFDYYYTKFSPIYLESEQKTLNHLLENGSICQKAEDYKQGIIHYQNCIDCILKINPIRKYDQYMLSLAYEGLSACFLGAKEFQQAMRMSLKSLKIRSSHLIGDKVHVSLLSIGKIYHKLGDFQNALIYYMKTYENMKQNKVDPLLLAKCEENIAYCYENLGDLESAIENYIYALKTLQQNFGIYNVKYVNNLKALARVYKRKGNNEKSKMFESKAKDIKL